MNKKGQYESIQIASEDHACIYCGQVTEDNKEYCGMCKKHMEGAILTICRTLVMDKGRIQRLIKDSDAPNESNSIRAIAVGETVAQIPAEFSKRTYRYPNILKTEGLWFSHLLAYRFVSCLRTDRKLIPASIMLDPMYQTSYSQVMDYLKIGEPKCDQATIEAVQSIFIVPGAAFDARRVLGTMIYALEDKGRLTIEYPKTLCSECGKELKNAKTVCEDCESDVSIDLRRSIVSALGSKKSSNKPATQEPSLKKRGMHTLS